MKLETRWAFNLVFSVLLMFQGMNWFLDGSYLAHGHGRRLAVVAQVVIAGVYAIYAARRLASARAGELGGAS